MPSSLNFPSNPTVGQQHAVGPRTFSWDGAAWRVYSLSEEDPVLTQEEIQDFVAPLLEHASHTNITATYDDDNGKIILAASGGGGGDGTVATSWWLGV
jgi:ribosome biogenesis SPOUT family RNA methylase Rps3